MWGIWSKCVSADMGTSTHIDNKKKYILVLGRGPTQGLESTLTAKKNVLN